MRTVSISGFGGSYEWGCQRMLQLGIQWLKIHPDFDFSAYKTYRGIYGVLHSEGSAAKELDDVLFSGDEKLREHGVTGAMHQAVIGHLAYIHARGYSRWMEELAEHRPPADFFEFDGSEQSCPPSHVVPIPISEMVCTCGHQLLEHAVSLDAAAEKLSRGDFTAPCHACDCTGYKERMH